MWPKKKSQRATPIAQEVPSVILRRAKMIPTADLLDWSANAAHEVSRNIASLQARTNPDTWESQHAEAVQSAGALYGILRELEQRHP